MSMMKATQRDQPAATQTIASQAISGDAATPIGCATGAAVRSTHHSLAPLRHDETHRFVGPRRLDRTGGKEQPAIIRSTQTITRRRREANLWKHVGKIGADRCCFGDHDSAMPDGWYFPHRIDREIGSRLHRRVVVEQLGAIGLPDLLEHPPDDSAA